MIFSFTGCGGKGQNVDPLQAQILAAGLGAVQSLRMVETVGNVGFTTGRSPGSFTEAKSLFELVLLLKQGSKRIPDTRQACDFPFTVVEYGWTGCVEENQDRSGTVQLRDITTGQAIGSITWGPPAYTGQDNGFPEVWTFNFQVVGGEVPVIGTVRFTFNDIDLVSGSITANLNSSDRSILFNLQWQDTDAGDAITYGTAIFQGYGIRVDSQIEIFNLNSESIWVATNAFRGLVQVDVQGNGNATVRDNQGFLKGTLEYNLTGAGQATFVSGSPVAIPDIDSFRP